MTPSGSAMSLQVVELEFGTILQPQHVHDCLAKYL